MPSAASPADVTPLGSTWYLAFPAEMEARFEADTGRQRARELVWAGLAGLLVYNLFLILDQVHRPELMHVALFWRLGVVTPYGLLILALVRRGLPPPQREAAMVSTLVVAMWGSGMIFQATTSASVAYDPFTFSLFFLVGQVVFQLRFPAALCFAVLGVGLGCLMLLGHALLPVSAVSYALGIMLANAMLTTLAGYRLERAQRHAYLLIRRETERSQVALQAADAMATLSQTDALTQVANRRAFDLELPRRWEAAARHDQTLSALMIDIDHFKRFNDRYGHPAGDACLRQVAAVMRANLREGDFLARIGGEEFSVLIQASSPHAVSGFAERLRQSIEQAAIGAPVAVRDGDPVVADPVTVSVGVALVKPRLQQPPLALIEAADAALYRAKAQGRNRCVLSAEIEMA